MSKFEKLKHECYKLPILAIEKEWTDFNYVEQFHPEGTVGMNTEYEYNNVHFFKYTDEVFKKTKFKDALEDIKLMYERNVYKMDKFIYFYLNDHPNIKKVNIIKPFQCISAVKGKYTDIFEFEGIVAFE